MKPSDQQLVRVWRDDTAATADPPSATGILLGATATGVGPAAC